MNVEKSVDAITSRAVKQYKTENAPSNLGEMPEKHPMASSWKPPESNEHRYKSRGRRNYQRYEDFGDKNYPYGHRYDYSESRLQNNLYYLPPSKMEAEMPFRNPEIEENQIPQIPPGVAKEGEVSQENQNWYWVGC